MFAILYSRTKKSSPKEGGLKMDIQALFEKDKNGLTLLEALILKTITAHLDTIMNLNQDTLGDVLYNYIMDKKEEAERQERLSQ